MKKNINQILDKESNIEIYFLAWLLVLSFLLRLAVIYFVRDTHFDNEWNTLLDNLINTLIIWYISGTAYTMKEI